MTLLTFFFFFFQECKKKGQQLSENLINNEPGDDFTEHKLLLKKAEFHHQTESKDEMLSTLERLNSRDAELAFLLKHNYFEEAAAILMQTGDFT